MWWRGSSRAGGSVTSQCPCGTLVAVACPALALMLLGIHSRPPVLLGFPPMNALPPLPVEVACGFSVPQGLSPACRRWEWEG